jgi:hypothetical protein
MTTLRSILVSLFSFLGVHMPVAVKTRYRVECFDALGNPKWVDGFENLVVTTGRNALLDNTFNAAAGSVTWYVGLKGTGTPVAADTMASHASWSEIVPYSEANRPTWTKNGAAASGTMSNSSSKAAFTINGSATVYGAFLTSNNTKSGTSGTLYGAGDFSAARAVESGDTLNVTVEPSVTAS